MEYCDFDNKESLLGLIHRNIKQQEGRTEEATTQEDDSRECNAESTFTTELTETHSWRLRTWFTPIKTSHIMTFGLGGSKYLTLLICIHVLTGFNHRLVFGCRRAPPLGHGCKIQVKPPLLRT